MALVQDSTGLFLEPTTGQYYSPYTAPPVQQNGYMSMSGFVPYGNQGMGGMFGNQQPKAPEGLMNFDGRSFVPFTGDMAGVSQGKRSVVDSLMGNRSAFQYNAPSLAQLFPALQGNMQGGMPMQNMQPSSGAGRFIGGLLGNMPTPVSSETTQAPSSGAGRFL